MRSKQHIASCVFSGADAIRDFMDPDCNPPLPLVELPERLNPLLAKKVHIYAKLLYLTPLMNSKSLPALEMLRQATDQGRCKPTLVESSSGNTVFSLALLAPLFGVESVRAVVPMDLAPGKLEMLRLSGADVRFASQATASDTARQFAREPGVAHLDQYGNPGNIAAHNKWTAKQTWEQTEGKLSILCAGLGTSGTALGAQEYFEKTCPRVAIVGVYCAPGNAVPGVRSEETLAETRLPWRQKLRHLVAVTTKDSYQKSLELCRAGLLGGPSSGFALAGLLQFLETATNLDEFRNQDGDVIAAFVCPDTPFPYLDKYSTILDPQALWRAS